MDKIIAKVLEKPNQIPQITFKVTAKDADTLEKAIKENYAKKVEVNILRFLLAQCYDKLGDERSIKQILDISFPQIDQTPFAQEARLRISQALIKYDQFAGAHFVEEHLTVLDSIMHPHKQTKARIQAIRAGLCVLRNDFSQAAACYLNASREQCFRDNKEERDQLIEKAIANVFIAEKTPQLHQFICTLYVNDSTKKTSLYSLLTKLYSDSMVHSTDLPRVREILPERLQKKDSDNVSLIEKAVFSHNMRGIMKSFSKISMRTLCELIGVGEDEMYLLIEKIYRNGEMEVDQMTGIVTIKQDEKEGELLTKNWFDDVDELLVGEK